MKIKNLKFKIIFFGSSSYVIPIIEVLRKNFALSLVVTTEKAPTDPVISYCKTAQIPHLSVSSLSEETIRYTLNAKRCDLAILADFGLIIPREILNLFPKGILNIHPSLLPKYRGPTPVQTAILNGEKTTGVSIIKLDEQVDHGSILVQKEELIKDNDTAKSLYERLFKIGADLLPDVINKYLTGEIKPKEQDHKKATFTKALKRQDGFIEMANGKWQMANGRLKRMIPAYYPWPGAWTRLRLGFGGQAKLKIIKFLPEEKIQVEGKKPISYKDFLNGYPEAKEILSRFIDKIVP